MRLYLEKDVSGRGSPFLNHIPSASELETTYEATRAGFVALALERNYRATPFVAQARALKVAVAVVTTPLGLIELIHILPSLLTAAGVSDKAAKYLTADDKTAAILRLIREFLEPAGANFVEELVYRFLLTRGDSLGGAMRNIAGAMANRQLIEGIRAALALGAISCLILPRGRDIWEELASGETAPNQDVRGLAWRLGQHWRTLLFNQKVPLISSNVDTILLNCDPQGLTKSEVRQPARYLALGELKGGIDPAGADEHWKTARTALQRVRASFAAHELYPQTFFVGAAIEKRMATELWQQLNDGVLSNAANLTDVRQFNSFCQWLVAL